MDASLRQLERTAETVEDQARVLREQLRAGRLVHGMAGIRLAAYVLDPVALRYFDDDPSNAPVGMLHPLCKWLPGIPRLAPERPLRVSRRDLFGDVAENIGPAWWAAQAGVAAALTPYHDRKGEWDKALLAIEAAEAWLREPSRRNRSEAIRSGRAVCVYQPWAAAAARAIAGQLGEWEKDMHRAAGRAGIDTVREAIRERLAPLALETA